MSKEVKTIFIHVIADDKQLSVHADVNKPLSEAVDAAFKHHKKTRTKKHKARDSKGKVISLAKTPAELKLKDDYIIYTTDVTPEA